MAETTLLFSVGEMVEKPLRAGHLPGDQGVESMMREPLRASTTFRVWTIQRESWWLLLQERGAIHGDGRRIRHYFRPAYKWLMDQMTRRVPGYDGSFPLWFWYQPKPDLRHGALLPRGEHGVRLELELPREIVLLSDFETWHCVLNRWHLSRTWRAIREWERKTKGFDHFNSSLPAPLEAELQSTWEKIFDLDWVNRTRLWGPVRSIQGTAERVLLSEVRDVQRFVAR